MINTLKRVFELSFIVFFMASFATAATRPMIRCYIGNWEVNQDDNGPYPISKIDFSGMTVLDWMAINPSTASPFFVTGWEYTGSIRKIISAAHAAGVKVICTVGSANTESLFQVASDSANLPVFVDSLKNFVQTEGFDGIDVDWEFLEPQDTTQWKNLIIALRKGLPRPQYLLTATSGNSYQVYGSVQSYLDQVGLMTYGMGYPSPGWLSDFSSPIYSGGHVEAFDNKTPTNSINSVVQRYESVGVPASKIAIGCEPGGEYWEGITGPFQSISLVTNFRQDIPYTTIMSKYYEPSLYHWDSSAEEGYLSFDTTVATADWFLSYDDTNALKAKLAYVDSTGLGGLMIYEIGMSYDPKTGTNPFLDVTNEFLHGTLSITVPPQAPESFFLSQNFPNPFNPTTTISYRLLEPGNVKLAVYDVLGRIIATLVDGTENSGDYSVDFNGSDLPSGVYFYRLQVGASAVTRKLVLIK